MHADQSLQHADDMLGAKARRDLDHQAFAGVLVDDRQAFDLLAVGAGIEHEIIGPDVVDGRGRQRLRSSARYPASRPPPRHLKPAKVSALITIIIKTSTYFIIWVCGWACCTLKVLTRLVTCFFFNGYNRTNRLIDPVKN